MKIKIKPYIITLIKENILYIISGIVMCLLIFFFVGLNFDKIPENDRKMDSLSKEIQALQAQVTLVNSVSSDAVELDSDIRFLNTLIPNSEDYFSIIYTLEKLSQQTNFLINSYAVNIKGSNANKLSLSITGVGDRSSFINFLKNYNFSGGRLMTSDKIDLSSEITGGIKLDVFFYNKKTPLAKTLSVQQAPKSLAEVAALKNKIQFSLKEASPEGGINYSYPKSSNLF